MPGARLLILAATLFATAVLGCTAAQGATFTTPVKLAGANNAADGGEPSIASDGKGNVYVDGPQKIPSGANGESGIEFWASRNDGTSFGPGVNLGSYLGGGDSDVITTPDGSVYIDDLEAVASEVCKSTDHGATFTSIGPVPDPNHCSQAGGGQTSPSDDRPWLTTDAKGTLYLTYHEFVSAQPIAFRSDNGGADDFANPCGPLVTDPTIESNVPTDITGGTLVAKPVTDAAGNLYVLFATTTQAQNMQAFASGGASGTFSQLYLAVSHDKCQSFTDYTVFDGSKLGTNSVQFGDIFNAIAVDGAGNLYTVGTGFVGTTPPSSPEANVYLFSSTDHGKTWKGPNLVGSANAAHMMPAAAGGPNAGQLAIGYYQTVNGKTDPNDAGGRWTYTTAETSNATAAQPGLSYADVNPGFVYHKGQICNEGILCGLPNQPSDRSLADFTSATIDAAGCPLFTFAGNPDGDGAIDATPQSNDVTTFNYATRQLSGCFQSAAATTSPGVGAAGTIAGGALLVPPGAHGGVAVGPHGCIAGRRLVFSINPVPGGRVVKAVAYVNGRKVAARRGRSLTGIAFTRPKGSRLNVKIVTTNNMGGSVITHRTFVGCARTKVNGRTKKHKVTHKRR